MKGASLTSLAFHGHRRILIRRSFGRFVKLGNVPKRQWLRIPGGCSAPNPEFGVEFVEGGLGEGFGIGLFL